MTKYEVNSDSTDSIYTVTLENGIYNCSCKWGQHHENGLCKCFKVCSGKPSIHHCKHVKELTAKTVFVDVSHEGLKSSLAGVEHVTVGVSLPRWLCCGAEWMAHTLIAPHTKFQMHPCSICGDTIQTDPSRPLLRA